jgi:hypothetical protein
MLGSGLSRAAQIPTGWEITLELVRKVATLQGADCGPDAAAWYSATTGKTPDYAELLDAVAKTPAERQQLLRTYWEPTEQERDEGAKLPTQAHRAIAQLVKLGYIRVILTTNFDRLLEVALHEVGIQPTVLSTPDHIEGALPLIHTGCTVIKLHGDYLDTRIRNTREELAEYPEPFTKLLDRVFDEFGLVVAGWSAEWDEALRGAMTRSPYRRFSVYWASRGQPGDKAKDLIARRSATVVNIADADSFFGALVDQVKSLHEFNRPHPLSSDAAVATLKRYLSDPSYRIALDDLVAHEVDAALAAGSGPAFDVHSRTTNGASLLARLRGYEAGCETLMRMAFVAGQWADGEQVPAWCRAIVKLSTRSDNGVTLWLNLQRYPATLLWYAFGMGALMRGRLTSLVTIFQTPVPVSHRKDQRAVELMPIWALFDRGIDDMKRIPGRENEHTPLENHLEELLRPMLGKHFTSLQAFELTFDRLEVLQALANIAPKIDSPGRYWTWPGSYVWRTTNAEKIFAEITSNIALHGAASPYVADGFVGATPQLATKNVLELAAFSKELGWW